MPDKSEITPAAPTSSTVGDPTVMVDDLLVVGGAVPFDKTTPEQENRYHDYTGNAIPWFVRGFWIIFWGFAIAYTIIYVLPAMQQELLSPP